MYTTCVGICVNDACSYHSSLNVDWKRVYCDSSHQWITKWIEIKGGNYPTQCTQHISSSHSNPPCSQWRETGESQEQFTLSWGQVTYTAKLTVSLIWLKRDKSAVRTCAAANQIQLWCTPSVVFAFWVHSCHQAPSLSVFMHESSILSSYIILAEGCTRGAA